MSKADYIVDVNYIVQFPNQSLESYTSNITNDVINAIARLPGKKIKVIFHNELQKRILKALFDRIGMKYIKGKNFYTTGI